MTIGSGYNLHAPHVNISRVSLYPSLSLVLKVQSCPIFTGLFVHADHTWGKPLVNWILGWPDKEVKKLNTCFRKLKLLDTLDTFRSLTPESEQSYMRISASKLLGTRGLLSHRFIMFLEGVMINFPTGGDMSLGVACEIH